MQAGAVLKQYLISDRQFLEFKCIYLFIYLFIYFEN